MEKDHTVLKFVGIGAGCLLIIAAVGAFLISRFYFYTRGPIRMIDEHIEAINAGNYRLAYGYFSEDLQEEISYQEFRENLEEFSSLLPSRESSFSNVNIVNDKASVEGTLTGRDGAIFPVEYELIKEKGVWRISTYHWISPGERIQV